MSFLNPDIIFLNEDCRSKIPDTLLGFLRTLMGLTVIDIKGKDSTRSRVITTLIHGNEPSGLIATHLWLKCSEIPATNLRIILCNPEAARSKPCFTNRYVQHSEDLNRYFSVLKSNESPVAHRARQITQLVRDVSPEAIIDMHNTSGSSPAFSVSVSESWQHLKLAELFTSNLILTQLNVGAIMELDFNAPIVTIECGGANDNASHQIALNGMLSFVKSDELFSNRRNRVQVLRHPIRIELVGDASVGFAHHRLTTTDITLRADIEELNKDITPQDEFIGWCCPSNSFAFKAIDAQGDNQVESLFENRKGCIFTKKSMQLFMVTTIPEIATKDCLFYTTLTSY